jgi:predicted extracellular nuclease
MKKLFGLLIVTLCIAGLSSYALAANPGDLIINEVIQNPAAVGDAVGEWFELYNTTAGDIDIDGWTMRDDGSDSHVIDNGGPLLVPAGGYLVLGNNADPLTNGGYTCDYAYPSSFYLANGDDELVLDDGAKVEIARIEWDGGPVWPDPTGASMAFMGNPANNNDGTYWVTECLTTYGDGDFGTPGAANTGCTPIEVTIYDIQYTEDVGSGCYDSPFDGQVIRTQGIVSFVFPGTYPDFYMQEGTGPFEGVLVYDTSINPAVGDEVWLEALVDEYNGMTELKNVSDFEILDSGLPIYGPTLISTGDLAGGCTYTGEQWEGMLVRVENVTTTQEENTYGEWYVSDGSGEAQIDDKFYAYDTYVGEELNFVQGFVEYSYSEFEILPRGASDIGPPEAIELASFEAVAGDGQVTLKWRTESEVDNFCFNIYRNDEVLATVDAFGDAHDYVYVDRRVTNGQTYTYRLSDVDLSGVETIHPMTCSVTPSAMPTDYVSATVLSFRKTGN